MRHFAESGYRTASPRLEFFWFRKLLAEFSGNQSSQSDQILPERVPVLQPSSMRILKRPDSQLTFPCVVLTLCGALLTSELFFPNVVLRAEELPNTVVDVIVEGNETIPASVILQKVITQPGRPVTNRQLREDKRNLMNTRLFYDVRERFEQTPQGTVLIFKVHERPIVQKVEFRGIKKLKDKQLASWTGLKVGSPFDHIANREAVYRIEQEYKERGYYFIDVKLTRGSEPSHREVIFDIKEGPKVRVQERVFRFIDDKGNDLTNKRSWTMQRLTQNNLSGLAPSASRLRTKLVSKEAIVGLFGGFYKPETLNQDVDALKQYYRGLGFFDIKVDAKPLFSEDRSSVRLLYTVNEGIPYRVRDIALNGNYVIPESQLRSSAKLRPGMYFNSLPLTQDIADMIEQYGVRGHYFASVVPVPKFTEQPGVVDLVFEIDEDRPRYIRDINVDILGDSPHTKSVVLVNQMLVEPGDKADPALIKRGKSRVGGSGLFENPNIEVVPVNPSEVMNVSHSRNVRGQNGNGQQAWDQLFDGRIDPTSIRQRYGHSVPSSVSPDARAAPIDATQKAPAVSLLPSTTTTSVVKYTTIDPGGFFHRSQENVLVSAYASEEPVIRAQGPGYGQPPVPGRGDQILEGSPYNPQFQALPPGWVDINIAAAEGRTGRLMVGAGVNSDAGIVGSLVWDERNFDLFRPPRTFADIIDGKAWRGGGQRFRLEAAPGDEVSRYTVSWTDPYFLYTDYSLGVSGFYFNRYYPDWDETRLGGRVSLGKQLTPEWSINGAFRFEDVEIENPRTTISSGGTTSVPELEAVRGNNQLITFTASATHDTRDSTILPSEGHFAQFKYEQAFGQFDYPRLEADGRQYITMFQRPDGSGRQVLTFAGNLGWSGDDTPAFERYYAGGFQSFRGFAFRGITPRGEDNISIGGTWQMLGTVEYRVPLTADDMISLVAFSDFGTVQQDVSINNFRVTVGAGLRLTVPAMGPVPLAFDFGFPIRSSPADDERIFSFYVGINR